MVAMDTANEKTFSHPIPRDNYAQGMKFQEVARKFRIIPQSDVHGTFSKGNTNGG